MRTEDKFVLSDYIHWRHRESGYGVIDVDNVKEFIRLIKKHFCFEGIHADDGQCINCQEIDKLIGKDLVEKSKGTGGKNE